MTDNEIIKANDILSKFDLFGGQRAGRELWFDKPDDVQNEDIENFSKDVAFLKDFINRQQAEIEHLEAENKLLIDRNCELAEKGEKAIITFVKSQDEAKYEAIKEFAERLKFELEVAFDEPIFDTIIGKIIESTIDKLLKELTHEPTKIEHNSLCETETYESR